MLGSLTITGHARATTRDVWRGECEPRDVGDYDSRDCVARNATEVSSPQAKAQTQTQTGVNYMIFETDSADDSIGRMQAVVHLGLAFVASVCGVGSILF